MLADGKTFPEQRKRLLEEQAEATGGETLKTLIQKMVDAFNEKSVVLREEYDARADL